MSNVKRGKSQLAHNDEQHTTTATTTAGATTTSAKIGVVINPKATADAAALVAPTHADCNGNATYTTTTTTTTLQTATTTTTYTAQQQQQTYLPQTSLLKIEPFVPSFNQRLRRRPIGRSYSTLSTTVIHKRTTNGGGVGCGGGSALAACAGKVTLLQQPQTAELIVGDGTISPQQLKRSYAAAAQLQRQRLPARARGLVTRQRSKSTSSSAASNPCRPATAVALNSSGVAATVLPTGVATLNATPTAPINSSGSGSLSNGPIVLPQPNGICRITRTPREREELPDRINYDRRGLTAVPIFEQEPHLRLLSLQHNLINIFHIPKETPATVITSKETKHEDQITPNTAPSGSKHSMHSNVRLSRQRYITHNNNNNNNNYNISQRLSPCPASSNKCNSPTHSQHQHQHQQQQQQQQQHHLAYNNGGIVQSRPKLLKRHSLLQRNFNFNAAQQPSAQQQQQQQRPLLQRFALEKSKSFVSNYSRHLHAMKQQHNLNQRRTYLLQSKSRNGSKLRSFDSGASGMTSTTVTTISTTTTTTTLETAPSICEVCEEPESALAHQQQQEAQLQFAIKNKQLSLSASYGSIFQHLVFLDLYDNQIERIANLDGLPTLTVLLLGKNRITDITGLASLRHTLRVLDLHGNKITSISNKINCLQELKSLNLAGNQIRQINHNDFSGLGSLKELNLKRNKIKRINGFQHLVALERLWLCHNELHKVDDMASIAKTMRLLEVTIENNPVSLAGDCVSFLVSHLPHLQTLSQMPITEQVRRAAMAWRQHKELAEAHTAHATSEVFNSIRREEVISNARTNWELLRSQQTVQTTLRAQRSPRKMTSELAKISESNETVCLGADSVGAGGDGSSSVYEELQALIKLPPIEQQQHGRTKASIKKAQADDACSSDGSSLGPNVDSCSSCYSTDNEDAAQECKRQHKATNDSHATSAASELDKGSELMAASKGQEAASGKRHLDSPQSPATRSIGSAAGGSVVVATTTTITLPLPQMSPAERPTSARQRLSAGTAASRAMANTPTQPINGNALLGYHNSKQQAALLSSSKRYMAGSLVRAQTVAGNGRGSAASRAAGVQQNSAMAAAGATGATSAATASPVGGGGTATATAAPASMLMPTTHNSPTPQASRGAAMVSTMAASNANNAVVATASASAAVAITVTKPTATEREREQGGDYLIEICGRYLNIYGQGALRFIDKQWNPAKANDVHTLNFSYINFNNITSILCRIKVRFPHAEHFVFRETNISCLGQLNALAELQGITTLYIDAEGNAITTKELWRSYAIYRLSHWGLKQLNGTEVSEAEVECANATYAGLSDLVLWSMPDVMLQPLLARLRLDETCTASKMSPKEWLQRADNISLRLVVGKEALQWKKSTASGGGAVLTGGGAVAELAGLAATSSSSSSSSPSTNVALSTRERGRQHFAHIMEQTCNAVEKLNKLETLWPSMLLDIVRNTLLDYAQLDVYLRNLMAEIMK